MGHSQAEKTQTHDRIVRIAAERFRKAGLEGVGVADLMKSAGLTVGGFYKHFGSREDLVIEALQEAMRQSRERTKTLMAQGKHGPFAALVRAYLSPEHRDCPETGCPAGALSGDAARGGPREQELFAAYIDKAIEGVSGMIATPAPGKARAHAVAAYSTLVGALILARAVGPGALSDELLKTASDHLIAAFGPTSPD
ncbi:TetR/AcrR family transcriptional regulator [Caulobacter sp. S45]|uniref:TetR/AcrR family transcriptional regulator n=1 Tax=Caulobacter sp. S45 TaxID=1641861 RepID=UPI00131E365A|nr:TetR/AcrR family transcriptional regulator [Caulobacter sp. S45]